MIILIEFKCNFILKANSHIWKGDLYWAWSIC